MPVHEDLPATASAHEGALAAPEETHPGGPDGASLAGVEQGTRPSRWVGHSPSAAAMLALVIGMGVTAVLALLSLGIYDRNERRLLDLRVRELALVLSATTPALQTPLASGATLATETDGSAAKFRQFFAPEVGPGKQFTSLSLWPLGARRPLPTVVLGTAPVLASMPGGREKIAALGRTPGVLKVTGLLGDRHPSLGLEYAAISATGGYAVYAETALPANRRSRIQSNSAFADLNYVLYLGRSRRASDLLLTSVASLPLRGRTASDIAQLGSAALTLVVGAKGPLGGTFFEDLPWIVAIVGALVTLAAAVLIERLVQRRRRAEELARMLDRAAAENRSLYVEQRGISHTLQHALLPEALPPVDGLKLGARYIPAASEGEVGGDWYDVVVVDERRVVLIVGDVSGHGLQAATTMALVRHAALAYVAQDPRPATVLSKLSSFVNGAPHAYFATALCALIEVDRHRITLASAGHLAPLLLEPAGGRFLELSTSPPVGFPGSWEYRETTVQVPAGATLIAFTDGLVERRGEVLDIGLERLREIASGERVTVIELLARIAREMTSEQNQDDTALVGIQWQD